MAEERRITITSNPARHRYEAWSDGELAGHLDYRSVPGALDLVHTEVSPEFEGHGVGGKLAEFALADIEDRGLGVRPTCPFVRSYIKEHPEYEELVHRRL